MPYKISRKKKKTPILTIRRTKALIKDEKQANRTYKKYGLTGIAKDEKRHAQILTKRLKKNKSKKTKRPKRLTTEEKYRWLKNNGIADEQYSSNIDTHFGQSPTSKEINDGYIYFKRYLKK